MLDPGVVDVDGLDELLLASCARFGVPGAQVGLLHCGQRTVRISGVAEQDGDVQVTPRTPFHAGSIAKAVTALVVVDAAARGELDLDVPCSQQSSASWPDTPRAIMAQTTGRPNDLPGPDEDLAGFVARVAAMPRVHQPGRFSYGNAGWPVLDLLLRERTGSGFEDLAAARVLGADSWFGEPVDASSGHGVSPGGIPTVVHSEYATTASAAGSRWWVTADRLLDFAGLHLARGAGRFAPETIAAMQVPHAAVPGATMADGWGLGWALWDRGAHRAYGWAGFTGGHRAYLRCFPDQDAALVVLANAAGPLFGSAGGSALFDDLLPTLLERLGVPALPAPDLAGPVTPAQELAGTFGPVTLTAAADDTLVLGAHAFGEPEPLTMLRSGGNTFEVAGRRPGPMAIAVDGDLLYLGPFALPRTS